MNRNANIVRSALCAATNELVEYRQHISHGQCRHPKTCWYCDYYNGLNVRSIAQDDLNELLFGYCEVDGKHVFVLNPTNVFRVVEFDPETKKSTLFISFNDYSGTSQHTILNWTAVQWARILDMYPDKRLSERTCSGILDQLSKLKETV